MSECENSKELCRDSAKQGLISQNYKHYTRQGLEINSQINSWIRKIQASIIDDMHTNFKDQNFFVVTCPDPSPDNGVITHQSKSPTNGRFPQDASVRVGCNSGYTMDRGASGMDVSSCTNGKWYPPVMKCIPNNEGDQIL